MPSRQKSLPERIADLRNAKRVKSTDVLIVGSGPIGAVFARILNQQGVGNVLMIDMGAQESKRPGDHHKNSVVVQRDINLFTNVIRGQLSLLSVPTDSSIVGNYDEQKDFIFGNINPDQDRSMNLTKTAATRVVGGMSTHWTCCTPRQHVDERSTLFNEAEWNTHYTNCEELFNTNQVDFKESVHQQLVKHALEEGFKNDHNDPKGRDHQLPQSRKVDAMPLAGKQPEPEKNPSYIEWTCTATILNKTLKDTNKMDFSRFTLMEQTQCEVLHLEKRGNSHTVTAAIIKDLVSGEEWVVDATRYVVCGGAVLTAGIMAKSVVSSGLQLDVVCPALGKYLTEQTMSFCQVILKPKFVEDVKKNHMIYGETIGKKLDEHAKEHPSDPLPFPFRDFDPQVYTPYSKEYPWHTQIHRDAFGYGELPADLDPRLVVDLRFFGRIQSRRENMITWNFENNSRDAFDMPQPTFHFSLTPNDLSQAQRMKDDMVHVASFLGHRFVEKAEPKLLEPGEALHVCGVYRAGDPKDTSRKNTSVVSREGKVWDMDNLYLGGCGVIPVSNASNPTLTAACHAYAGAAEIAKYINDHKKPKTPGKK
ncbi:hypothetical protein F4802DRAFT_619913 [Xylaria palmicola]|nr:hypothetical protein F4802DRAFT_619913 [Xylaria palmicola]